MTDDRKPDFEELRRLSDLLVWANENVEEEWPGDLSDMLPASALAKYLSLVEPKVVLALLSERDALRAALEALARSMDEWLLVSWAEDDYRTAIRSWQRGARAALSGEPTAQPPEPTK